MRDLSASLGLALSSTDPITCLSNQLGNAVPISCASSWLTHNLSYALICRPSAPASCFDLTPRRPLLTIVPVQFPRVEARRPWQSRGLGRKEKVEASGEKRGRRPGLLAMLRGGFSEDRRELPRIVVRWLATLSEAYR
jgi:hypothetical protein